MHHHISGVHGVITALYFIAILGTLNLLAMRYMNRSNLAASYANLFGLS